MVKDNGRDILGKEMVTLWRNEEVWLTHRQENDQRILIKENEKLTDRGIIQ